MSDTSMIFTLQYGPLVFQTCELGGRSDFIEASPRTMSAPSFFERKGARKYKISEGHPFGSAADVFEEGMVSRPISYRILRALECASRNSG